MGDLTRYTDDWGETHRRHAMTLHINRLRGTAPTASAKVIRVSDAVNYVEHNDEPAFPCKLSPAMSRHVHVSINVQKPLLSQTHRSRR